MGWAALIPVAASVLGSLTKGDEKQQQPQQAPPSLGEIFAMNSHNELPPQVASPFAPSPIIKTGGGFNG